MAAPNILALLQQRLIDARQPDRLAHLGAGHRQCHQAQQRRTNLAGEEHKQREWQQDAGAGVQARPQRANKVGRGFASMTGPRADRMLANILAWFHVVQRFLTLEFEPCMHAKG